MVKFKSILFLVFLAGILVGCSTKKNTSGTRFYHAFTARYNTYYNGHEAYKNGYAELEATDADNYMEMLPYYFVGNKKVIGTGSANFDKAIEKAGKAIKRHSIKKKPVRKPGEKKTAKLLKWYAKREYNPFIHHAWMLMGKAQFQKGDFLEAVSTFSYISRLYASEPAILAEARLWMVRCYTELEWYYDAEDVLDKVERDSMPRSLNGDRNATAGNLLLHQGKLKEALPLLESAVKKEHGTRVKARHYFLLGQIYQQLGNNAAAYRSFGKVIKMNPPYKLEFNARIKQSEVAAEGENSRTIKRLERMASNPKNKDYLDQVYYAIGNIYLVKGDTAQAVRNYELGAEKGTRSGVEKGILLLRLGDIYWAQADYTNAQRCYAEVIGLLDKEHSGYAEVSHRSEVLDALVGYAEAVELQDSLQRLAKMSETERMAVIEQIIERVKEEEKQQKEREELEARMSARDEALAEASARLPQSSTPTGAGMSGDKSWYFYNAALVSRGKSDFGRKWGRRALEDNWRRKNKTVVNTADFAETNYDEEELPTDSTELAGEEVADSLVTDNKNPQFYIQQIPLTPSQMEESNAILSDGLFNCGLIYKDRLEDFALAEKAFGRLCREFPEFEKKEVVLYNLYLMYSRWGKSDVATSMLDSLKMQYPAGDYTVLLSDPDYAINAVYGKQLEDSLYASTYKAYVAGDYLTVEINSTRSSEKYPLGKHRPKFLFLHGMTMLADGNQKGFLENLKIIVEKYPENEITELAGLILNGVKEGRLLRSADLSSGSIWARRRMSIEGDSLGTDSIPYFSAEKSDPYLFILAYEDGALNENQLLYEVARFNFSNFMVRNFDIQFVKDNGIGMMQVGEFMNLMECVGYMRRLFADATLRERLEGIRVVLISKPNYELLQRYYSFEDYKLFYDEKLSTIPMPEMDGLLFDEPEVLNAEEAEKLEEVNEEDYFEE